MKKNNKIRKNFVKESLLDYNNLTNTLKENTESAVKNLLKETVLEQYAKILTEDEDEEEYDVEEVNDTDSETTDEDNNEGMEQSEENIEGESVLEDDAEDDDTLEGDENEEWSEFDKYKVSDGEYDFSEAEDEEIVKVYKLLKDDDQVVVTKKDDKVSIKDDETGAEYLIDLGDDEDNNVEVETNDNDFGASDEFEDAEGFDLENDFESQEKEDMKESRIYEIALNEYDSNVGYTDNYQSKDVMTNPGMSEPGKNVNDWDKGVPKGTSKPWSGKKNDKSENQPFTAEKGKAIEEEEEMGDMPSNDSEGAPIQELKTRQEHTANVLSTSRTDGDNGNRRRKARSFHTAEKGQETGTPDNPYKPEGNTNENIRKRAEKIFAENKQLKEALVKFKKTLEEAAVTNVNLGNIIKLVMENSTSNDEKKEIIARFGSEAKTIQESKNLYNSISSELKKKAKMDIHESKNFLATENKQINETQIYQSNDILNSLDLMHRICK